MLRVHFTAQDLMRVGFASRPAPLMELGLAAATLQRPDRNVVFARWRAARRREITSAALPLFSLVPPNGAGPLFLDPLSDALDDGMDGVLSAPRAVVTRELRRVCPAYRPVTPWVLDLARQDRRAWRTLERAVRAGHQTLVSRDWARMQASFAADLAYRGRLLAEEGLGATLASLYPGSVWSGTTLHIDLPRDSEITLTGDGLTLMPSSVWTGAPLVGQDAAGRPLLLYPALTPLPMIADRPDNDPLVALLGRTRAAVLRSLVASRTTTEVAGELGISLASASQHTTTLRAARLVTSARDGKSVWHTVTPLGGKFLD